MVTEMQLDIYCEQCKNVTEWEFRQRTDEKGRLLAMVVGRCKKCHAKQAYESWTVVKNVTGDVYGGF